MKQSVYIFLLLLNVQNLLSQEVKVDLSLSWSKSKLSVSAEYDTISHPYLFVKYSNLTQDSIYIPRTIYGCNELPLILSWEFPSNNIDYYKNGLNAITQKIVGSCNAGKYDVQVDQFRYTLDINEYTEAEEIESNSFYNMRVEMIQKYIAYKNGVNYISKNNMSTSDEVNDSERYVFLNPGETLIDCFNLVAFMILHGEYVFYYNKIPCNTPIMEIDQKCYYFPDMKNRYRLYCGSVVPDTLSVIF